MVATLTPHTPSISPQPVKVLRKRGGQLGNQNARKAGTYSRRQPGPLSQFHLGINELKFDLRLGDASPLAVYDRLGEMTVDLLDRQPLSTQEYYEIDELLIKLIKARLGIWDLYTPYRLKQRALEKIAHDPFSYFEAWYRSQGITCDADSFFPVSKLSAHNSPLPPDHPAYSTNLTDDQWAVLAPLIPPPPRQEDPAALPPVIIAANRWDFSHYTPDGEFADFVIMQEYEQVLKRLPAPSPLPARSRGRPPSCKNHPRALLDAILWKIATGHNWDDLPQEFPPMRLCRKYYRRLFLSGRFYTLMLALYNHMRFEWVVDPYLLLQEGLFTTTPSQKIALVPDAPQTSANYTALLFMQLARSAYSFFDHANKKEHPHFRLLPVFKGDAPLSTGCLHSVEPPRLEPDFQPITESLFFKDFRKAERARKAFDREVARLLALGGKEKQPSNPGKT